jgi:hypothetical protein
MNQLITQSCNQPIKVPYSHAPNVCPWPGGGVTTQCKPKGRKLRFPLRPFNGTQGSNSKQALRIFQPVRARTRVEGNGNQAEFKYIG